MRIGYIYEWTYLLNKVAAAKTSEHCSDYFIFSFYIYHANKKKYIVYRQN